MNDKQAYIVINKDELLSKTAKMKEDGYLLTQISVTKKECFDMLYTFEKDYDMINLRIEANDDDEIESINKFYVYAYLYENEMKDLFGVKIINLDVDFKGHLYKTSVPTPFNQKDEKPEEVEAKNNKE